jgi:hypothetical protein
LVDFDGFSGVPPLLQAERTPAAANKPDVFIKFLLVTLI